MTDTVTREEFEAFKRQQDERLTPLAVGLEVVKHDTTRLLSDVADVAEALVELRDELTAHRQETRERFSRLEAELASTREEFTSTREELTSTRTEILRVIDDKHAVLLSAIMQLGRKAP